VRTLLVIGLPQQLARRFEVACRDVVRVASVRTEIDRQGRARLIPYPHQAVLTIDELTAEIEPPQLRIIVLPYAPLPPELRPALEAAREIGAEVLEARPGTDAWPAAGRLDHTFLEALFHALSEHAGVAAIRVSPRQAFTEAASRERRLILAPGAIDEIDEVPVHRHTFLRQSVGALERMAMREADVGHLEAYFRSAGIAYAKSGRIVATLEILGGPDRAKQSTEAHLKQGDSTSRVAATRIYFDIVRQGDNACLVVLHAGPHPVGSFTRQIRWPFRS